MQYWRHICSIGETSAALGYFKSSFFELLRLGKDAGRKGCAPCLLHMIKLLTHWVGHFLKKLGKKSDPRLWVTLWVTFHRRNVWCPVVGHLLWVTCGSFSFDVLWVTYGGILGAEAPRRPHELAAEHRDKASFSWRSLGGRRGVPGGFVDTQQAM